ncbi:hypothetical protein MNEG_14507, partial [Monoraphidium neglectum]
MRGCNIDAVLPAAALPRALSASAVAGLPDAAPPPWALTLSRVAQLDVSDAEALSPETLAALLGLGTGALRRLAASGCRALAAAGGAARLRRALLWAFAPRLPSLHALSAGWGFTQGSTAALLGASPFLTRLELGLGAECGDGLLMGLAEACPDMQELTLRLAAVGTPGVSAVLAACRKLRILRLQQCAGPLDGGTLLAAAERQPRRWRLEELQLVGGGPVQLLDRQLLRLLQAPAPAPEGRGAGEGRAGADAGHGACSSSGDCGGDGGSAGGSAQPPVATPLPPPPPPFLLHTLALVNVRGLSDALLLRLAAAAPQLPLQHLRLEDCFVGQRPLGGGGGGGGGGAGGAAPNAPHAPWRPSFSQPALLRLLTRCPALASLRLRHAAAPLDAGFVAEAAGACPLLQHVLLDQCDLADGGFRLAPDAYSPFAA